MKTSREKKTQCHSLLFVTSRTLTAGCLIYIAVLIYHPICIKNKGNCKRVSSKLTKKKGGGEGGSENMFVACLYKTLRKKEIKVGFPVASVQDIIENPMYLMTEGAEA